MSGIAFRDLALFWKEGFFLRTQNQTPVVCGFNLTRIVTGDSRLTLRGKETEVHEEKIPTVSNASKKSSKVAENSPYLQYVGIESLCEDMVHDMLQEEITLDEFRKLIQKI